jgi:hypothetical protein
MTATDAPYQILRHFVSPEICRLMFDYCVLKRDHGLLSKPDDRIPTAARQYGDPLTETLLLQKHAAVEQLEGHSLWPSYSYVRVHSAGAEMPRHLDRDASHLGLTINLGGDQLWPIWFDTLGGPTAITLDVGDGVLYQGSQIAHWREPYAGTTQVQCMLFFVRKDDPNVDMLKYDGRTAIGAPRSSRLVMLQAKGLVPADVKLPADIRE